MDPFAGFNRVHGTPLCCAVADLVRTRRTFVRSLGKPGRRLLQETEAHWRFDVTEALADGDRLLAFGRPAGSFPAPGVRAEVQQDGSVCAASVEYQPVGGAPGDACLSVDGPAEVTTSSVPRPAECGEREH
ncbi:hypothetical protein ACIHEJ_32480 [Streptomyces sp. NPDC052301]|uniref:hypothetical protein n=1 Tax=Streptomyces sp. NPDC052301 TaxID=3365687 RepID=UPI0037D57ED1